MSYSEWMGRTGAVIDEKAAVIATALVLAEGLIVVVVRHREILIRHKKVKVNTDSSTSVHRVDTLANHVLGGKASGQ